ncbi:MAG: hypothetical protein WA985_00665 [Erythrobacter sp.]
MTISASTKIRAIGGASVLALTAGIAAPVFAQDREPAPAPTAPAVPDNTEECTFEDGLVTCVPGVDPDGIFVEGPTDSNDDDSDGDDSDTDEDGFGGDVVLDIQDGAYLQGPATLLADVDGTVAGAIVTDDSDTALVLFDGSNVEITSTGYIQTSGDGSAGVEIGNNANLVNGGTIYTTGDNGSGAVVLGDGTTFTNSGLVRTDGEDAFGVIGGDDIEVVNTVDGSIVTTGDFSLGVALGDNGRLQNDGEIETFGGEAIAVVMGDDAEIITNLSIRTAGDNAFGISTGSSANIANSGLISTTGAGAIAIVTGEEALIDSNGTIETSGDDAFGVLASDGALINFDEDNTVTTTGDFAGGVVVDGGGEINNGGLISTAGEGAVGVFINGDESTFENRIGALVTTTGDDASAVVLIGDSSYVQNDGAIATTGANSIGVEIGTNGLVVTNDSITTEGDGAVGIFAANASNIFNSGIITTAGANAFGIAAGDGAIVETDDAITTTGDGATGIVLGEGSQIRLEGGSVLSTSGADASGVAIVGDVELFQNFGSITATGEGSNGVDLGGAGVISNFAGGSISGEVGIDGSSEDDDSQEIRNFGSITGTGGNAVLFGGGDDEFQQWDTASLDGLVDGGDGDDTLVFGNAGEEDISRDLGDLDDGETFDNFETFAFLSTGGAINLTGDTDLALNLLGGDIVLSGTTTSTVFADGTGSLAVTDTGSIDVEDGTGVIVSVDDFVITNAGTISSGGFAAIDATGVEGLVVNNTGLINANGDGGIAIYGDITASDPDSEETTVTVSNSGTISATDGADFGVVVLGNAVVGNTADGTISSTGDGGAAVFIAGSGTIDNDGTITASGDGAAAVSVGGDASVDNSGDITADGDDSAGVLLFAGGDVVNSGTISGGVGVAANFTDDANSVTNFGSIVGTDGNAVLLGNGDDEFQAFNGSSVDGVVDGGDGTDRLVFGNNGADLLTVNLSGIDDDLDDDDDDSDDTDSDVDGIDASYINFETVGFRDLNGGIDLVGESDEAFSLLGGNITLSGTLTNTLTAEAPGTLTVAETGVISTDDVVGLFVAADGFTVVNGGMIASEGESAIDASTVTGFTLANTGMIQSDSSHAISLNQGDITNAGLIEAPISDDMDDDDDGDGILAAISFAGDADEESTVTNQVDGTIRGDIAILAFADGSDDDDDDDNLSQNRQVVANFGTIEGTSGIAVGLGDGNDEFQQWTGASVSGDIALEGDDDTFILEGRLTSIDGVVDGGDGDDTVILAGILDRDDIFEDSIFENFENFQLGSTLGTPDNGLATLNDLVIEGDRTLENDVTIVGEVILGLGVDSLTIDDGTITLAETGIVTVNTPLDRELIGQTVAVLVADDTDDQGGTINIIDDDLLLAYTPTGLLSVTVSGDNPVFDDTDRNIRVFGDALADAVDAGTLDDDTFEDLNDLGTPDAFRNALADALPSLSGAVAREIFETASASSQAIAHPHANEGGSVWGQVMYRTAEQGSRTLSTDGYDSDQLIFTAGIDFLPLENFSLGVIGSYADIENDDTERGGAVTGTSDVESIKVGGYASGSFFGSSFFTAELSYLTGEVEDARTGFFGDTSSAYDFDGYFARAELGIDLAGADNVGIVPTIGVHHASIDFDDSVETGGFGFDIERGDVDFTELRGGLEINGDVSSIIQAYAEATYIHDLEDSPRSFTLNSAEVGPFTAHLPLREQDRFEVAAGAMIGVSEGFGLELGYLGDFADDYNAHSARANLRITF